MTQINITQPATLPDLIVYGAKALGTPSLVRDGLQLPVFVPIVDTASSKLVDGEHPYGMRKPNGVLAMKVRIEHPSIEGHELIVATWETALTQLSYSATVDAGGRVLTYTCLPGSITPDGGTRQAWPAGQAMVDKYLITIPVLPNPVVAS